MWPSSSDDAVFIMSWSTFTLSSDFPFSTDLLFVCVAAGQPGSVYQPLHHEVVLPVLPGQSECININIYLFINKKAFQRHLKCFSFQFYSVLFEVLIPRYQFKVLHPLSGCFVSLTSLSPDWLTAMNWSQPSSLNHKHIVFLLFNYPSLTQNY